MEPRSRVELVPDRSGAPEMIALVVLIIQAIIIAVLYFVKES